MPKPKYDFVPVKKIAEGSFQCSQVPVHSSFLNPISAGKGKLVDAGCIGTAPDVVFDIYVCGHCDATHMVFTDVLSGTAWNMSLAPQDAEMIAAALNSPPPRSS